MHRVLHIILVALVFACPLWCAFAKCGCSHVIAQAAPSCCCETPALPSNDSPDAPPTNPQPEKLQQCICGGAVLVDLFQLEHTDVWASLFAAIEVRFGLDLQSAQPARFLEYDDELICSGRMLRQLYDTWTL